MTPHGLNALLAMRMRGQRPDGYVQITLTDDPHQARHVTTYTESEAVIRSSDNVETLDFRALFGMPVIVIALQFGPRENRLLSRLMEVASEVVLYVVEWIEQGGEFGVTWQKGGEVRAIERVS